MSDNDNSDSEFCLPECSTESCLSGSDASYSTNSEEEDDYYDDYNNVEEERLDIIRSAICNGTLLNLDYLLLRKIGEGNSATVWICYKISDKNYYAIKVQNPLCYNDGVREVDIINCINKYNNNNVGQDINCVVMLDSFKHVLNATESLFDTSDTTNNEIVFVCSVYQLYAGSLQRLIDAETKYEYGLPINVVKRITRQLLNGADILHRHLHIVHTDLHLFNILFEGDANEFLSIVEFFVNTDFEAKYAYLSTQYNVINGVVPKDVEYIYVQELEFLCKQCIDLMAEYEIEYSAKSHEKMITDTDRKDKDDMTRKIQYLCSDSESGSESRYYSEGSVISDYSEEEMVVLESDCRNTRNQSVADLIQELENDTLYNLDEDLAYDFDIIKNESKTNNNTREIISDEYVINCNVAITDFGNSYFLSDLTENEIQSRWYRAPEIIFNLKYNEKCDIWSIGCTVFELLTGYRLFYINDEDRDVNKDLHHLYVFEKLLGPIPEHLKLKSNRLNWLFDAKRNYHIKNVAPFEYVGLEHVLQYQHLFSEQDATDIANFLRSVFVYDPEKRPSAQDLLKHEWLVETD